ncbi:hypothetical protein VTI28DRAFT_1555 [Corynascus sepedonium]
MGEGQPARHTRNTNSKPDKDSFFALTQRPPPSDRRHLLTCGVSVHVPRSCQQVPATQPSWIHRVSCHAKPISAHRQSRGEPIAAPDPFISLSSGKWSTIHHIFDGNDHEWGAVTRKEEAPPNCLDGSLIFNKWGQMDSAPWKRLECREAHQPAGLPVPLLPGPSLTPKHRDRPVRATRLIACFRGN